jgi:hypothetical protein
LKAVTNRKNEFSAPYIQYLNPQAVLMKSYKRSILCFAVLFLLATVPAIQGSSSGKHNQASSGCTCHSNAGGITVTNDFPTSYNAGQVYNINISHTGGTSAFVGGFNVMVDKGTLQNAGTGVKIQSGTSATHTGSNQLGWAFDWQAPVSGSGSVSVNIAVLQGNGNGLATGDGWGTDSVSIAEIVVQNTPPVASNAYVSLTQGSGQITQAYHDQELFANYDYTDDDDDVESNTQIRWSKDGTAVSQRNDFLNVPQSYTSIGEVWTMTVTPSDGSDLGTAVASANSVEIIDYDSDNDGYGDQNDAFPDDPNEHQDSDSDGVGDNADVFPNDSTETIDTDGDGVGDNGDWAPNDATESADTDGDGVGDNADAFPDDATETIDTDGDGVGDNADAFPNDPNESSDFDGDGVGDIADVFPNDATESSDADSDGVGDNADVFPNDATESVDSDGDGVGDNADVFPNDASETIDTDGDGVGDNADVFPDDATETLDTDMDGVGDNADAFPDDATETLDTDMDGVGDNADAFPDDATETLDTDMDGVGDNADAFPNNAAESTDSDMDGVGDNADALPNDATETLDDDGDGVGNNADAFPTDASESTDSDVDGVGDNADAFPDDATETLDTDGDGVGDNAQLIAENLAAEEEAAQKQMFTIIGVVAVLIIGVVGAVLFMRRGEDSTDEAVKDFSSLSVQPQRTPVQQTYQQPVAQQPVVAAEPVVLQQWTDEAGYTWRQMDDGSNHWWTGNEWQRS